MEENLKEILNKAKEISKYGADGKQHTRFFNQFEAKSLLDHIANLQEERDMFERMSKWSSEVMFNYKSRNDKAIDLIKEAGCYDEETKKFCDDIWEELPELLNTLTGGDE